MTEVSRSQGFIFGVEFLRECQLEGLLLLLDADVGALVDDLVEQLARRDDHPRVVDHRLLEMLPDIEVFLDVDNLGGGKDHPHIDVSNVVLCFCTRRWFTNKPCVREIVRAVLREKRIIALLEADTSETKGGHTEAECREIIRGELYATRLSEMEEQVAQWAEAWGQPEAEAEAG